MAGNVAREEKEHGQEQNSDLYVEAEVLGPDDDSVVIEDQYEPKETSLADRPKNAIAETSALTVETYNVPRYCDGCYLADRCPKYKPGAECAFRIEANVEGPADLVTIMKKLIEIQTERVMFGHFIEKMEGGYLDQNVSNEEQRLFDMIKTFKEILDNRDEINVQIKSRDGGGILSQIFGGGKKANND